MTSPTNRRVLTEARLNAPGGPVALDAGGKVPNASLPDLSGTYATKTRVDAALDATGKVLPAALPDLSTTYTPTRVPSEVNLGLRTGIDRTGATDMTALLVAAAAEGRPLYLPEGDYLANFAATSGLRLRGAGPGRTRLIQKGSGSALSVTGSLGAAVLLTADALAGAMTLSLSSTAGIAAGDYLNLKASRLWTGTDKGAVFGEQVHVDAVSGNTVNLRAPIEDDYAVADTALVQRFTFATGIEVADLSIQNPAWKTKSDSAALLSIKYGRGITLGGLDVIQSDQQAIELYAARDFNVDNVRFLDLSDNPALSRYGYGVDARESTTDGRVYGCYMRGGRHLFTTNANGLNSTVPLGIPRHILVSTCIATETSNGGFDTHFEGSDVTFTGNRVHGARAWGMAVRGRRVVVNGFTASDVVGPGIWVRENVTNGTRLRNIDVRNARTGVVDGVTYPGQGLRIEPGSQPTTVAGFTIDGTDEDGVYIGSGAAAHRFSTVRISNVGKVTNNNGIRFSGTSAGHRFTDLTIDTATNGLQGAATVTDVRVRGLHTTAVGVRVTGGMRVTEDANPAGPARQRARQGYYYRALATGVSTATGTLSELRVAPLSFDLPTNLTTIGLEITTAVASATVRLGIYADDGSGFPGALILDAGTIDASTVGFKEIAITQALPPGDYHIGGASQGAAATYRVNTGEVQGIPILVPAGNSGSNCYALSGVTGALPATFGPPTFIGGSGPRVFVKAGA